MPQQNHILLVEDDLSLIDGLLYALQKQNFIVSNARTVQQALQLYAQQTFNLILLDVTLPDGTGFEICRHVREQSNVPIIFLTAADEETNVVMGLDLGGDDYITKPFKLNELMARIQALLRRTSAHTKPVQGIKNEAPASAITVDELQKQVYLNNKPLELTLSEYKLMYLFIENAGQVLSRQSILDALWDGNGRFVDDNTLSVYIRRLRNKIEKDPNNPTMLITERGFGYKWQAQGEPDEANR